MSEQRKTIKVDKIRTWVNNVLAAPDNPGRDLSKYTPDQAYRLAMASLLGVVLHETGNYHGFTYLDSERNPDYQDGSGVDWLREGYDHTRRRYLA